MRGSGSERLLVAMVMAVLVGAGVWWYASGEYEERPIYRPEPGLHTETFRVAGEWLKQRGYPVTSLTHLQDLDALPASGSTLIVHAAIGQHNDLEARQLAGWLARGGHVIAAAPTRTGTQQPAVDLNPHGLTSSTSRPPQDLASRDDNGEPAFRQWFVLQIPGGQDLELWGAASLTVPDETPGLSMWRDDQDRTIVAEYAFDAGMVTVIPSRFWLDNQHLIYPDHARFLLSLLETDVERIYLQQRSAAGGLLGWLWRQAPLLWAVLALWLALWIWSRMPRLGPTIEPDPTVVRQMREHVLATARYDWRHNRGRQLIGALREQRLLRLTRRYPDWRHLDPHQQLARLAPLLDRADRLAWFLDLTETDSPRELTEYVALHNQLMHTL